MNPGIISTCISPHNVLMDLAHVLIVLTFAHRHTGHLLIFGPFVCFYYYIDSFLLVPLSHCKHFSDTVMSLCYYTSSNSIRI